MSDEEVREIQAAAHGIVPDTLLNISGVVSGCPCEDGAGCSDQVWIVAYRPGVIKGLEMSRIGQRWAIGQVQDRLPARTGKPSATAATSPSSRAAQ